jgi:hypothetical protein
LVSVSPVPRLGTDPPLPATLPAASLAASGVLLMAGLWTPVAGTVVAVVELSHLLTMAPDRLVCLLAGTVAGALAMLGPGRWSVDARLFGWKRIDVGGQVKPATRGTHQDLERGPAIR